MNKAKLKQYLKDYGFHQAATAAADKVFRRQQEEVPYRRWLERTSLSSRQYARMGKETLPWNVQFAVQSHSEGIDRASFVQSLNLQIYRSFRAWKDCPDADYILFAGSGCTLAPDLLYQCALYLSQHKSEEIDLIYFDSDRIGKDGRKCDPSFRPEYDPDLLRKFNYIGNVFLVKREAAQSAGIPVWDGRPADEYHEFLKRIAAAMQVKPGEESSGPVRHIAKVLYHEIRVQADDVSEEEHVPTKKEDMELISVLIPNCDHLNDLERCIDSLRNVNAYGNLEILIIENNSRDPETFAGYDRICAGDPRVRVVRYESQEPGFNFSAICNFGAVQAHGEYLLYLNNDTAVLKPSALWYMTRLARREDVGAVGALLMYPDHTVQHAGVILGWGGIAGHAFQKESLDNNLGTYPNLIFRHTRNVCAVTAACMMLRRAEFEKLGGFDEKLEVTFNDIDLCLRLRESGLRVLMCPDAELIHYESASRGAEDSEEKVKRFHSEIRHFADRWEGALEKGDPFYNPNLTLTGRSWTCKDLLREVRRPYLKYLHLD